MSDTNKAVARDRPIPPWLKHRNISNKTASPNGGGAQNQGLGSTWTRLQAAVAARKADDVISSLEQLTRDRHQLGSIGSVPAQLLTDVLKICQGWPADLASQAQTLALPLLARWALTNQTAPAPSSALQHMQQLHTQQLSSTVEWVLNWVQQKAVQSPPTSTPQAIVPAVQAAAILFIGASYAGISEEQRRVAVATVCELLRQPQGSAEGVQALPACGTRSHVMGGANTTEDVGAGVRLMVAHVMKADSQQAHRLLVCWVHAACGLADTSLMEAAHPPIQPTAPLLPEAATIHAAHSVQQGLRAGAQLGAAMRQVGLQAVQQLAAHSANHTRGQTSAPTASSQAVVAAISSTVALAAASLQEGCVPVHMHEREDPSSSSGSSSSNSRPGFGHLGHAVSAVSTLAAAGLLEGLDFGVRQLPAAQQGAAVGAFGKAVAGLVAGVQAGLSLACMEASQASTSDTTTSVTAPSAQQPQQQQQQQQQQAHTSCTTRPSSFPAASTLLAWAAGMAYAKLRAGTAGAALAAKVVPPGHMSHHLPGLAAAALTQACVPAPLDGLAEHALLWGAPPAAAASWLEEQGSSNPLFSEAAAVAKGLIEAVRAVGPIPAHTPPALTHLADGLDAHWGAAAGASAPKPYPGPQPVVITPQQQALTGVVAAIRQGAAHVAATYSALVLMAGPRWLEQVHKPGQGATPTPSAPSAPAATSNSGLRDALDRAWVFCLTPLTLVLQQWPAPATPSAPAAAAAAAGAAGAAGAAVDAPTDAAALAIIQVLADLQFCAVPLPATTDLARGAVARVAAHPASCVQLLQHGLPCYDRLIEGVQAVGSNDNGDNSGSNNSWGDAWADTAADAFASGAAGTPQAQQAAQRGAAAASFRWKADAVLAAKLSFLLPVSALCVTRAPDCVAAAHQLLPTLFLLMRHEQDPLVTAAHAAFAAVTAHLGQTGGEPDGSRDLELLEQVLLYYVQRNLQPPLRLVCLEGLASGLPAILPSLPTSSPTALYCLQHIITAASEWLRSNPSKSLDFGPLYVDPAALPAAVQQPSQPAPPKAAPEVKLVSLACSTVLLCDWQLLPQVAGAVTGVVTAAGSDSGALGGGARRAAVLQHIHDMLVRSDDYARKPQLLDWLQEVVAEGVKGGKDSRRRGNVVVCLL